MKYVRPLRAGVIPYTRHGGKVKFGPGTDARHHEITDYGGGVSYRRENAIGGALREFHEESLGVFAPVTEADVAMSLAIFDKENLIIFVEVDVCPAATSAEFHRRLATTVDAEVSDIVWFTAEDFRAALIKEPVYEKVRTLLLAAGDFMLKL